jgi:hypothetical protein
VFDANSQSNPLDMSQRRLKVQGPKSDLAENPDPQSEGGKPARQMPKRRGQQNLDSEEMLETHATLLAIHRRELDRQYENRAEQAIDEDFYDNIQWPEDDAQVLRDRKQMPLVYNVIGTALNWVTGTEKRSRTDYKILPRRKDDGKPAERKTALMKYLSDVNRSPFHKSRAFEDAAKVGVGWLECGIEDSDSGDPLYDRYESWRNMLWDSACTELDMSDARFVDRSKWVDEDILSAMFHERVELICESVNEDSIYAAGVGTDGDEAMDSREIENQHGGAVRDSLEGYTRPRIRTTEMWFRKPVRGHMVVGGMFGGDIYDFSDAHNEEIHSGRARLVRKRMMRVHVAVFTIKGMLWYGESPYRHNRFPFTPIWAYRRGRDGMPYGMIRGLRDIQMDINKRASKALHILSSNKVVMDEGAVDDLDQLAEEVAQPDSIIVKKKGHELRLDNDRELAQAHLELMSRSIQMIQSQSGITDELMGRKTNAVSGVAIQRRQDQGSTTTTNLFDNLRFASQVHGEKKLSLIEQYYTEQKQFRITSMRGSPEYVTLNSGLPEDDITRSKADFIISEADWHATLRQSAVEALLETMKTLPPQIAMSMIDLVVENMDLPNRDEIVKRIRSATGLPDPDADPNEMTPEKQAEMQAKAKQQEMADQTAMAGLEKLMGEAKLATARASHAEAQTSKVIADVKATLANAVNLDVTAQTNAIKAAIALLAAPMAEPVADQLLAEAGFVPAVPNLPNIPAASPSLANLIAAAHRNAARQQMLPPVQSADDEMAQMESESAAPGIGLPSTQPQPAMAG